MPRLKTKVFLPLCLAGLLAGYAGAEWVLPNYFHPNSETRVTAEDLLAALGSQPTYYRQTASGNYLAGQFAQRRKDWESASDMISRILEKEPENIELKKHAMVLAMEAGQINRAIFLAKQMMTDEDDNILSVLFASLDDFRSENYLDANATLAKVNQNSVATFIVPALTLWADSAQGKLDVSTLEKNHFYAYQAMLVALYLNKGPAVLDFALEGYTMEGADIRDLEKIADLFAQIGGQTRALEFYTLLKDKGFGDKELDQKINALKNNENIDPSLLGYKKITNPREGAAVVFMDMADILLREYSDDSAVVFSQMALYLDPNLAEPHLIIGTVLARHKRFDEAVMQLKKIDKDSPRYITAQQQIGNLYVEMKENDKAIDVLMTLYKRKDVLEALIQIGDIYRYEEDYKNSVKTYNQVLGRWDQTPEDYWHVLYARGMAEERLKNFERAEEDLLKALSFRPNHPYILNYLGYSWADQGINLNKSLDMITKAAQLKPDDGYIADSLGWVYYKMKDFDSALPHIERAVELLPYDATINDHLGDVYWQTGRRTEARFQWQRAANYSADNETEIKEQAEKKVISGLTDMPLNGKTGTMTGSIKQEIEQKTKPAL